MPVTTPATALPPARAAVCALATATVQPDLDDSLSRLRGLVDALHATLDVAALPAPGSGDARLLDALPAAVLLLDRSGSIAECNAAARELLGADVSGQPWGALLKRRFAASEDQTELVLDDGRRLTVATRPMPGAAGQVVMLSDVSEARALQELLARRSRLAELGEMLARLAHQLGTPLATAALNARELTRGGDDPARRRELAERLEQSLARMRAQVRDMQVFTSNAVLTTTPVRVGDLLEGLRQQAGPHYAAANASLDIDSQADDCCVRGNAGALASVFLNLADNALQMCPRALRLEVSAMRAGEQVALAFQDNGPGVPPDLAASVFEPFFTTRGEGTGLGLAVARSVIEAHGGRIGLGRPHRGCRIEISLPAAGIAAASRAA